MPLSRPMRLTIEWPGVGGNDSVTASSPRTVRVPVAYSRVKNRLSPISRSRFGVSIEPGVNRAR